MEQTKIDIKVLKDDLKIPVDEKTKSNAIYVENSKYAYTVSQITLRGKHNLICTVVSDFVSLTTRRVIVDNDWLLICLFKEIAVVNLKENRVHKVVDFECYELFGIYKFKTGYFVHGELDNRFLDKDFDMIWELGCGDIFFNSKVEKDFEIFEEYIVAWDWYGYKHYYNESGEFKTEHYPEYRMSD